MGKHSRNITKSAHAERRKPYKRVSETETFNAPLKKPLKSACNRYSQAISKNAPSIPFVLG